MTDQQHQLVANDDDEDEEIYDIHGAIQYRDNSAAMTPRLNNDPLRTVEDIRAAYSANNTQFDDDHDFREMPQIFSKPAPNSPLSARNYYAQNRTAGILAALASSIVAAGVFVCVRSMRNENPNVIVMYSGLSGAVFCLVLSLFTSSSWISLGGVDHLWLPLLAVGGLAFVSQFTMTCALRTDSANIISLARASEVLWGYMWQVLIFHNTPDTTSLLGAAMILGSVILLTLDRFDQQCTTSSRRRSAATLLADESSNLLPAYNNNNNATAAASTTETRVKTANIWQHYPASPPPYDATEMEQQRDDGTAAYRRPVALFAPYQRAIANNNNNYEPI